MNQELKVDANQVIEHLSKEISIQAKEKAILQTRINDLYDVIDKQKKLIDAYEEKEELAEQEK